MNNELCDQIERLQKELTAAQLSRPALEEIAALWDGHADCDYENTSTAAVLALIRDAVEYDGELLTAATAREAALTAALHSVRDSLGYAMSVLDSRFQDAPLTTRARNVLVETMGVVEGWASSPPTVPKTVADRQAEKLGAMNGPPWERPMFSAPTDPPESDTPRTNSFVDYVTRHGWNLKLGSWPNFASRLERELAAANAREAALTAALNLASGQALESMAREVVLREALKKIAALDYQRAAVNGCAYSAWEMATSAITHPAPTAVPKAVADGLAEEMAMIERGCIDPYWARRAREALAKYKAKNNE